MKVAFSGSSGSGKTTLVTFVSEALKLKHISGSAGDVKTEGDKMIVDEAFKYPGGGHAGVIRYSALNPEYGLMNQTLLKLRRKELVMNNDNFVTDRSPADNLTYMVNQVAYHPMITDAMVEEFARDCQQAWDELTHVIYVKAVQPKEVERNGSRIANSWYQKAIDAQFELWINYFMKNSQAGPEVMIIDYWDLEKRKEEVLKFLGK
jgi:gluconate kinase